MAQKTELRPIGHLLVENYPAEYELTQFEKVLVAARRAKDLHRGDAHALLDEVGKASYIALLEFERGLVEPSEEDSSFLLGDDSLEEGAESGSSPQLEASDADDSWG